MRLCFRKSLSGLVLLLGLMLGFVSSAEAQDGYRIKAGDTLQVEVLEDPNLNRTVLVLPDGSISFPLAGTVQAGGRSVADVRQSLVAALAPNFATSPTVFVSVAALAAAQPAATTSTGSGQIDVYALGEVGTPGKVSIKRGTTLLQFLAEAGGLTKFAAEKRIELHRTDKRTGEVTSYLFNYRTPAGGADGISGSTKLAPGDVVKVPQRRLFE